ncbi:hypothetical protein BH23ACT5_BH23ACT5_15290 [soil metagenome]
MTPEEIDRFAFEGYPALERSGIRCETAERGRITTRWPHDEAQLRPGGYIAGPTQFMVADTALWFLAFTVVGLEAMAVTSDLHLVFLRPAIGDDLWAEATTVAVTKRRMYGTVRLWVGDTPDRTVSHATGSYALPATD